jgi:hypothetical protein
MSVASFHRLTAAQPNLSHEASGLPAAPLCIFQTRRLFIVRSLQALPLPPRRPQLIPEQCQSAVDFRVTIVRKLRPQPSSSSCLVLWVIVLAVAGLLG